MTRPRPDSYSVRHADAARIAADGLCRRAAQTEYFRRFVLPRLMGRDEPETQDDGTTPNPNPQPNPEG
ncbi:MAG TPA: hypothetical protein VH475_08230 [Tepidisphaeraceae bacterium]